MLTTYTCMCAKPLHGMPCAACCPHIHAKRSCKDTHLYTVLEGDALLRVMFVNQQDRRSSLVEELARLSIVPLVGLHAAWGVHVAHEDHAPVLVVSLHALESLHSSLVRVQTRSSPHGVLQRD